MSLFKYASIVYVRDRRRKTVKICDIYETISKGKPISEWEKMKTPKFATDFKRTHHYFIKRLTCNNSGECQESHEHEYQFSRCKVSHIGASKSEIEHSKPSKRVIFKTPKTLSSSPKADSSENEQVKSIKEQRKCMRLAEGDNILAILTDNKKSPLQKFSDKVDYRNLEDITNQDSCILEKKKKPKILEVEVVKWDLPFSNKTKLKCTSGNISTGVERYGPPLEPQVIIANNPFEKESAQKSRKSEDKNLPDDDDYDYKFNRIRSKESSKSNYQNNCDSIERVDDMDSIEGSPTRQLDPLSNQKEKQIECNVNDNKISKTHSKYNYQNNCDSIERVDDMDSIEGSPTRQLDPLSNQKDKHIEFNVNDNTMSKTHKKSPVKEKQKKTLNPTISRKKNTSTRRASYKKRMIQFFNKCINFYREATSGTVAFTDKRKRFTHYNKGFYVTQNLSIDEDDYALFVHAKSIPDKTNILIQGLWTDYEIACESLDVRKTKNVVPGEHGPKKINKEKLRVLISIIDDYMRDQTFSYEERIDSLFGVMKIISAKIQNERNKFLKKNKPDYSKTYLVDSSEEN